MKKIVIVLISLSTACCAMTEDQQRAAWAAMRKAEGGIEQPSHHWYHALTVRPDQQALDNARKIFSDAGITPPPMFTTYEGRSERTAAGLRKGSTMACVDKEGNMYLSPRVLTWLNSDNPSAQSAAKQVLFHENTHRVNKDSDCRLSLYDWQLPESMEDAWMHNVIRRQEIRADKEALKHLSVNDLLNLKTIFEQRLQSQENSTPLHHPSDKERLALLNEELEDREKGERRPESQSEAAKSFFSRNREIGRPSFTDLAFIGIEMDELDRAGKLKENSRDLGDDIFVLNEPKLDYRIYYIRSGNSTRMFEVSINKTSEESDRLARKHFLNRK